jgi:hypothetical protein
MKLGAKRKKRVKIFQQKDFDILIINFIFAHN